VARVALVDAWADRRLDLWADRRGAVERAPLEVAGCGPGGEKLFQGAVVRWAFAVALEPAKPWRLHLRLAPGRAGSPA
jgi:hypothetical protein